MIDKPCKPDHEMIRTLINDLRIENVIEYGTYGILMDYINDCECLLNLTEEDCNDKEAG